MAVNLGEINFGLGADTRRLDSARDAILRFGAAVNRAARDQSEGARAVEQSMRRQEKAMLDSLQTTLKLNEAIRKTGANPSLLQTTTNTFNRLVRELAEGRVTALQFQRSMEDFQASTGRVTRGVAAHTTEVARQTRTQKEQTAAANKATDELAKYVNTVTQATLAVERFNTKAAKVSAPASYTTRANDALNTYQAQLSRPGNNKVDVATYSAQFRQSMQQNRLELEKWIDANKRSSNEMSSFASAMDKLASGAVLLYGPLSGVATRLTTLATVAEKVSATMALTFAGVAGGALLFASVGSAAIESARKMERVTVALESVRQSQAITSSEMDYLRGVANRAGVEFDKLVTQYTRMTVASMGTSLEGERTRQIFEAVTFAAAKLGSTNDETAGTLRAIEQMMSKGKISAEELRQQLGDRLPGAVQIMAQALGVSTSKLDEMMKKGELTLSSLVKFSDTLKQRLGIDTTKSINTVTAAETRLSNAFLDFGNSVNEVLGFSEAYKNFTNFLAASVEGLARNLPTVVALLGAVAGGLVAIAAPTIISGIVAVAGAVRTLTATVMGLSAALMTNPLGAFATVLLRVGLVIAGAVGGMKLFNAVVNDTSTSKGMQSIDEYIKTQKNLKTTIRETTQEYIKQAEVFAAGAKAQLDEATASANLLTEGLKNASDAINQDTSGLATGFETTGIEKSLNVAKQKVEEYGKAYSEAVKRVQALKDIEARQAQAEKDISKRVDSTSTATVSRADMAIKNAKDSINELKQAYDNLFLSPAAREWGDIQVEINKKVENFRDALTRAKVPASEVVELTNQYAKALRNLEEGEYILKHTTTAWQLLDKTISAGLDRGIDSLIDSLMEGEDAMKSMADAAKQMVADILKELLKLAVMNPIKNMLFGTNYNTLGGIGSMFGGSAGSSFSMSGGIGAAAVGTTYARGGLTMVGEKGPEIVDLPRGSTVIPNDALGSMGRGSGVASRSGQPGYGGEGGGNVFINQYNQSSSAQVETTSQKINGDTYIETKIIDVLASGKADKIQRARWGSSLQQTQR